MARILIVEDEILVAMLLEDVISDLGHQPVGPVMRLETALSAAEDEDFDLAILDINLAGKQSFPVAEASQNRGIPFMFASGYGAAGLTQNYQACPIIQKPFDPLQIAQMLASLADTTSTAE